MRLIDTGTVAYYMVDVGGSMFKVVFNFATNATDYTAVLNMDVPLDCIIEHFHAKLYGATAVYAVKLYDSFGRDVLQQTNLILSSGAVERIVSANVGDSRRGRIQTMGLHVFYVDANAETYGTVELMCRRPGGGGY